MRRAVTVFLISLAGLIYTSSATATIINYDEAVDGDINPIPLITPSFVVDMAGTHMFQGTASRALNNANSDTDRFQLFIDPGLSVVGYSVTLTNPVQSHTTSGATLIGDVDVLQGPIVLQTDAINLVSGVTTISPTLNLPLNVSGLVLDAGVTRSIGFPDGLSGSFDWKISIETAVVPLPAAAWLFVSALGGLFGVKRWKRERSGAHM